MSLHAYALDSPRTPAELGRLAEAVRAKGQAIYLTLAGQPIAAIVSTEDIAAIEAAVDATDLADAHVALASVEPRIPHRDLLAEYKLV